MRAMPQGAPHKIQSHSRRMEDGSKGSGRSSLMRRTSRERTPKGRIRHVRGLAHDVCKIQLSLQGGFCRQQPDHRSTDYKIGPRGGKAGRNPKDNDHKPIKPTETEGPCLDLKGFCIKALTVQVPFAGRSMKQPARKDQSSCP